MAHRDHMHRLLGLMVAFAIAMSASVAIAESTSSGELEQTSPLRKVGFDQKLGSTVPLELPFRDETGTPVTLQKYFGKKPVVLAMVYYECPMLCTLTLNGLVGVLKTLSFDIGKEFDVVTISFDPKEGPDLAYMKKEAYLKEYRRLGAENGWHFLTGDETSIRGVADAIGFRYEFLPEKNEFAHAAGIVVLTPDGRAARYFFGVEYAPRDVRLGLVEAADGKIGNPIDQLMLYCYEYDPLTGKYSMMILNIVRAVSLVLISVFVGFVILMLRRDRKNTRPAAVMG